MIALFIIGFIIGGFCIAYIANLVMKNQQNFYEYKLSSEKQIQDIRVQYSYMQAQNEILQEVTIAEKQEKKDAYSMFFKVAQIATENMRVPTQLTHKPSPALGLAQNTVENAVYTPNIEPILENTKVGEEKKGMNIALKRGVKEWLVEKDCKLFYNKMGIIIEQNGVKYNCDYPTQKGIASKVSTLPLYLGLCNLPACSDYFLTKEQSSKFCCDSHKNEFNNSK